MELVMVVEPVGVAPVAQEQEAIAVEKGGCAVAFEPARRWVKWSQVVSLRTKEPTTILRG